MKVPISLQLEQATLDYVDGIAREIGESRTFVIQTFLADAHAKRRKIEVSTKVKEAARDESAA